MNSKHKNGQRVRIRVKDQHGLVRYPNIQKYENRTGKIISSKKISEIRGIKGVEHMAPPGAVYLYEVQLDNGTILNDVEASALETIK